jgi:dimethylargininase
MLIAITRAVSRSIERCELTHLVRQPIDLEAARRQHRAYQDALSSLGVQVISLPEEPEQPDAVFVEDTAVVLDECALLTRPGADSRKPEVASVARALTPYRTCFPIQAPAALDGGDVLVVGADIYVGRSTRSNQAAVDQMGRLLAPYGYRVHSVPVHGCLHLKSAVTQVAEDRLLINPTWVQADDFPGLQCMAVDPSEPQAANALRVGETLLYQPACPRTAERLEQVGYRLLLVDASELAKAEGALTCCSLIFNTRPVDRPPHQGDISGKGSPLDQG